MSNPTIYIGPKGCAVVTKDHQRTTIDLTFDHALAFAKLPDILLMDPQATVKVVSAFPWTQDVMCHDCGHHTTVFGCVQTVDGLECPRCSVRGGMAPFIPDAPAYHVDLFERGLNRWYWSANQSYPWGPFATRELAVEDMEANGVEVTR